MMYLYKSAQIFISEYELAPYCYTIRNNGTFFYDDNSILNSMRFEIAVRQMRAAFYAYIIAYPAVLIKDSVFYITTFADADWRWLLCCSQFQDFFQMLIKIGSHHIGRFDHRSLADTRADSDNGPFQLIPIKDTAVGNNGVVQSRARDLRRGQHTRTCIYRFFEEIKVRNIIGQPDVCVKKRPDRTYVCPVAVKLVAQDVQITDSVRNYFLTEVHAGIILQQRSQYTFRKHIDAHG